MVVVEVVLVVVVEPSIVVDEPGMVVEVGATVVEVVEDASSPPHAAKPTSANTQMVNRYFKGASLIWALRY